MGRRTRHPLVDVREFLNLPGFHGAAAIRCYIEDTTQRSKDERYYGIAPSHELWISDCDKQVNLALDMNDEEGWENAFYKVDTLLWSLRELRKGMTAARREWRKERRKRDRDDEDW